MSPDALCGRPLLSLHGQARHLSASKAAVAALCPLPPTSKCFSGNLLTPSYPLRHQDPPWETVGGAGGQGVQGQARSQGPELGQKESEASGRVQNLNAGESQKANVSSGERVR